MTIPSGTGPFPAVLLISGSGPQNRDSEIFGHKPFLIIADHLTRAGIAVLRVDDPGVGGSTAHPHPPTASDFADNAIAELRQKVEEVVRHQFETNGVPRAQQDETRVRMAVEQAISPGMRYLLAYDPRPALEKISVPVLALNGELDTQVDAGQNLVAIAAALENNSNVTIHRLPGLNHLFQHAKTGLIGEYGVIEETISPEVLDLIRDWILTITQ